MKTPNSTLWISILVLCLAGLPALAQVETGRIAGTVTDATGAVVPGVEVIVTHVQTNRQFTTTTNAQGWYEAPALPIGDYEVAVEAPGFKRTVRSGITLEVRQTARSARPQ